MRKVSLQYWTSKSVGGLIRRQDTTAMALLLKFTALLTSEHRLLIQIREFAVGNEVGVDNVGEVSLALLFEKWSARSSPEPLTTHSS